MSFTIGIMRVLHSSHGATPKHHLVLGQRASFVRKNVLHLAKVLGDVQSSTLQVRVCFLIIKIHVLVYEVHLTDFDNLNGHKQGDWDQHLKQREGLTCLVERVVFIAVLNCEGWAEDTEI